MEFKDEITKLMDAKEEQRQIEEATDRIEDSLKKLLGERVAVLNKRYFIAEGKAICDPTRIWQTIYQSQITFPGFDRYTITDAFYDHFVVRLESTDRDGEDFSWEIDIPYYSHDDDRFLDVFTEKMQKTYDKKRKITENQKRASKEAEYKRLKEELGK